MTTTRCVTASEVVAGDGPPAPEVGPEVEMIVTGETAIPATPLEAAARDAAVSTSPTVGTSSSQSQKVAASGLANADDNIVGEPKIILGHPSLMGPGNNSLN
jgi:hypothetical protein